MIKTAMRLWLYSCPDEQVPAAAAALGDLQPEFVPSYESFTLTLVDPYYDGYFVPEGTDETPELATTLVSVAPGVSFVMRVWPIEEQPGFIHAYMPDLGHFHAEMNSAGDVVLSLARAQEVITAAGIGQIGSYQTVTSMRTHFDLAYGRPWLEHFAANGPDSI